MDRAVTVMDATHAFTVWLNEQRGRASLSCPKCLQEWPHEVPEVDWSEQSHDQDSLAGSRSSMPSTSSLGLGRRRSSTATKKKKASGGHGMAGTDITMMIILSLILHTIITIQSCYNTVL